MSLVYEHYMQGLAKRKQDMIRPIVAKVKDLKAQDYDPEMVVNVLYNEGCHALPLIEAAINAVYVDALADHRPPRKYEDVKHIIEASLLTEHPKQIVTTLTARTNYGSIMPVAVADQLNLEQYIAYVQQRRDEPLIAELHKTLKPYVENTIINLQAEAENGKVVTASSEKESQTIDRWFEWFGLWPPTTQKAFAKNSYSGGSIMHTENYEDGEYTFCPMHKTEINVERVCRASSCAFYAEAKTASTGEPVKICKFAK
jgi:hypothetical protein